MDDNPLPWAALAAGLLLAGTAIGHEYTQFETVLLQPADQARHCPTLGLLSVPPGWDIGDAAAIVVAAPGARGGDRLVAALLNEDTAVLELATDAACDPLAARPDTTPPPLPARIDAAVATFRTAWQPGLLVGIGHGAAGPAVLAAAGFAATVAAAGPDTTLRAEAPAAAGRVGSRWPRFCGLLAAAGAGSAVECLTALLPPPVLAARR